MAALPASAIDVAIAHQIGLVRYANYVVRRLISILNKADAGLLSKLGELLDDAPTGATARYLDAMLKSIRALNAQAYEQLAGGIGDVMKELAASEVEWSDRLYAAAVDDPDSLARVTPAQAYAAAYSRPFQGRLLREWAGSLEDGRMTRIRDTVRMGYLEGETTSSIVSKLRGTRASGYADGLLEIDRRHAESVIRTALSHTAGTARTEFYDANEEILGSLMWISTLDGKTSQPCRLRDQKRYTVETHKPIGHSLPWEGGPGRLHWCCRSTEIALLKGQTQLYGTRASANGPVPAILNYQDWLKKQSAKMQDEVLGPERAALFRTGGLKIADFSNDKGKAYTLDQLKTIDAQAFEQAGLNNPIRPPRGQPQDAIARFLAAPAEQRELLKGLYGEAQYPVQMQAVEKIRGEQDWKVAPEPLASIRYYTGSGYKEINRRTRESGGTLDDRKFVALAAHGLDQLPRHDGEVWRAPTRTQANADRLWDKSIQGEPLDLGNQLLSFSSSKGLAADWTGSADVLFHIRMPVGAYVEKLSLNPGEDEVLIPPGLRYIVVGKRSEERNGKTFRVIELEIRDE